MFLPINNSEEDIKNAMNVMEALLNTIWNINVIEIDNVACAAFAISMPLDFPIKLATIEFIADNCGNPINAVMRIE